MTRTLCFDFDAVIYKAASIAQERSIEAKHSPSGKVFTFKTRTEFYGHWKKKSGGWLAENPEYSLDDFEIEDIITPYPVEHALQIVKTTINNVMDELDGDSYYGYVGGPSNYRNALCTLLPYKGNRLNIPRPIHLGACKQYVLERHNAVEAQGCESDDMLVRDMYKALKEGEDLIGVIAEKDYKGCDGNWYDYTKKRYTEVRGLGKLWRDESGAVEGHGRLFKYFQVSSADGSDNYFAHCFSDEPNGPVTAFEVLKDCKNDKEAFLAMKQHFQRLYPEPKSITNWQGNTFQIDWFYVMQEVFNLAHLERWPGDRINLRDVFNRMEIEV